MICSQVFSSFLSPFSLFRNDYLILVNFKINAKLYIEITIDSIHITYCNSSLSQSEPYLHKLLLDHPHTHPILTLCNSQGVKFLDSPHPSSLFHMSDSNNHVTIELLGEKSTFEELPCLNQPKKYALYFRVIDMSMLTS